MIKLKLPKLKSLRQKFEKLSRKKKIVALVFGGVIVSGMIFVFAELGGYGVNGPATAPNSLNYGLVGYWNMEEGGGQVIKDKSGNGNDGTLGANSSVGTDDPVFAPGHDASGPNGIGLSFDGINDYATINATNNLSGGFSESFWFYRRSDAVQGLTNILTASGQQYRVFLHGSALEFDKMPGELGNVTGTTVLNQWTHAVVTHDGTTASVYINGALANQAVADFGLGTTTAIYVGSLAGGVYLNGAMDDLRIYNRAISADEVRLLYNQKKPILDLKFDEGSGTVAHDESFNNYDGTINGATWVAGKNGGALSFDGINDDVSFSSYVFNGCEKEYTKSAWIKTDNSSAQNVMSGDSSQHVLYLNSGQIQMSNAWGSSIVSANASFYDNNWHHLEVTYKNNIGKIYFDGRYLTEGSLSDVPANSALYVGAYAAANNFIGSLDNVRIYNYARTADEVLADYNDNQAAHLGSNNQDLNRGLVGYWDMEEGSGQTIKDKSGNGNDGTLGANSSVGTDDPVFVPGHDSSGPNGIGLSFDGVNDYAIINATNDLSGGFSESFWFYRRSDAGQGLTQISMASGQQYRVFLYGSALEFDNVPGEVGNVTGTTVLNQWTHVAVTHNGTTASVYINGVLANQAAADFGLGTTTAIHVGSLFGLNFKGTLDDLRIYNRAISADEVRLLYNQKKPILDMKFDEGSGTIAHNEGSGDYLSSWQYRKAIVVTNQVASSLTGYQAKLTVDTASLYSAGKMKIDGSDLRFADVNGVDIPYWIESGINTSSTIIWIKTDLASSEAKTVYMYYGNSTASAGSNGKNTFDIFDDFSGAAVDANIWNVVTYNGASVAVSGGNLRLQSVGGGAYLISKTNISADSIVRCNFKSVTLNGIDSSFRVGASTSGEMTYKGSGGTSGTRMFVNEGVSWGPSLESLALNNYYIYEVRQNGTTIYGRRASSTWDTYTVGNPASYNAFMSTYGFDGYADSYVDWVAVRKYAVTEPSSGAWSADEKTPNSDLALANSPTWVTGKFGTALNLTAASSQYGYTPDNAGISLTGNLTMSAWIKPTSVTASTLFDIAGKWDGANESYLLAQYGNQIRMYIDSSSSYKTTTAVNLTAGNWYHVEAVYTAASQTVDIYVNGVLQVGTVTGTIPASIGDDAGRFQIGAEDSITTAANFYDGVIDDFKLYSYARIGDEVLVDYNDGQAAHLGKNNQNLNFGLVGYWDMEEGSGQTIYDKSGNGNNGTLGVSTASETDDPVFSAGYDSSGLVGMGLLGDGGTDYVDVGVGTNLALTNRGAISLWIKPNSLTQDDFANFVTRRTNATGGTYANYSYTFHWRGTDSTIRMAVSNGDGVNMIFTSIPILADTNWHHLVGMWDGSFLTIYKDGVLASTPTAQTVNSQAGAAFSTTLLGNCFSTSATNRGEFNGTIDEVRIYNRALSTDEISTLYNQKKPVLDMKFDEGSGTVVHDESFNNKDGTLGGGTAAYMPVWTQGKFGGALSFDGSNDYVDISNALPIYSSTAYSISLWVKGASGQVDKRLFSQGASANDLPVLTIGTDQLGTTGKLDVFFRDENNVIHLNHVKSDGVAFDGNWHYVVWTDAAGSAKMYIDGIPSGSFTYAPPASVFAYNRAALGAEYRSTLSSFFVGSIDEVRVYNYTRTPAEVLTDYNNGQAAHLR